MKTTQVQERSISKVVDAYVTLEGPGIPIHRAIPSNEVSLTEVDPFLLVDDFAMTPTAEADESNEFGMHPHRGFEIVTYNLEGSFMHLDDQGRKDLQGPGGVQRVTAGSGIWHGGKPEGKGAIRGLQLWINSARKDKKAEPRYEVVQAEDIPRQNVGKATLRFLAGEGSNLSLHTPGFFMDVSLPKGETLEWDIKPDYQGYAYVTEGSGSFGTPSVNAEERQFLVLGAGERLKVQAGSRDLRFVLAAGRPIREAIRWRGPYVD